MHRATWVDVNLSILWHITHTCWSPRTMILHYENNWNIYSLRLKKHCTWKLSNNCQILANLQHFFTIINKQNEYEKNLMKKLSLYLRYLAAVPCENRVITKFRVFWDTVFIDWEDNCSCCTWLAMHHRNSGEPDKYTVIQWRDNQISSFSSWYKRWSHCQGLTVLVQSLRSGIYTDCTTGCQKK